MTSSSWHGVSKCTIRGSKCQVETILYWKIHVLWYLWFLLNWSSDTKTYYAPNHLLSKWKCVLMEGILVTSVSSNMECPSLLMILGSTISVWSFLPLLLSCLTFPHAHILFKPYFLEANFHDYLPPPSIPRLVSFALCSFLILCSLSWPFRASSQFWSIIIICWLSFSSHQATCFMGTKTVIFFPSNISLVFNTY